MNKPSVVYILGRGSRWNDGEIRYSLRSLEKYLLSYGEVFVIGEKLDWFSERIHHIPESDPFLNKTMNGVNKIMKAALAEEISDKFILMNDDFIFNQPVAQIDNYIRGTLARQMQLHQTKSGYYYEDMKTTKQILEKWGYATPVDYEVHYPVMFDKDKLLTAIAKAGKENSRFLIRSIYGNMHSSGGEPVVDFKAHTLAEFAFQKKREPDVISLSDLVVGYEEVQTWLKRKFPLPCSYENDKGEGLYKKPLREGNMRVYATRDINYNGVKVTKGSIIPDRILDNIVDEPKFNDAWRQA